MLKLCVTGSGISYTLSPVIHTAVLGAMGVEAEYGVRDIPAGEFAAAVPAMLREYDGFNVTKPFKRDIIPFLSRLETGGLDAVNVVKCGGSGAVGYNTDADGFAAALMELAGDVSGARVLMIGAGGAAEAVACALKKLGSEVAVINRTHSKAEALAAKFGMRAVKSAAEAGSAEIIVNCATPSADAPALPEGTNTGALRYAYDIVYSPEVTPLMTACEAAGAKTSNGLGMLIYQAIIADEIFTGRSGDRLRLRAAAEQAIKAKEKQA